MFDHLIHTVFVHFHSATLVKLEWILESILKKTVADCDRFIYQLNAGKSNTMADDQAAAPSPASKRNILLMSQTSKHATPKRLNFNDSNASTSKNQSPNDSASILPHSKDQADDELIGQYLQAAPPTVSEAIVPIAVATKSPTVEAIAGPSNADGAFKVPAQPPSKDDIENNKTDLDSELNSDLTELSQLTFLDKIKVHIHGFDKESHESLVEDCKIAGAEVIEDDNYSGTVDLLILPVDAMTMDGITIKAKCIVNHNWLVSAIINAELNLLNLTFWT